MDTTRFDAWTRSLTVALHRRGLLLGWGGAIVALLGAAARHDSTAAKPKRRHGHRVHQTKKGGGGDKGGKGGKRGKKTECENNGDCRQPDNPCEKKFCKGGKCVNDVRQDGTECGIGLVCAGGTCVAVCGASTAPCADGLTCCAKACVDTTTNFSHCGACGNACDQNTASTCVAGACQCGSSPACATGQLCHNGQCSCGADCAGCCDGASCRAGDSSAFCGTGGGLCVPCGSGQTCDGGHCVCTTGSCPGCCDDTICRAGTNAEQCGTGGGVCLACEVDQPCDSGHCAACDPSGTACATGDACCTGICSCGNVNNPEANRCHGTSFSQTFASTVAGWYDFDPSTGIVPGTPTTIERQGAGAIVHAGSTYEGDKTAFTLWGGYSATFPPGGYDTEIDIFLDPAGASAANKQFGYTSAINGTGCVYLDEVTFHIGTNASGTQFCIGVSPPDHNPCDDTEQPVVITTADWYTFRHSFRTVGGNVVTTVELRQGNNAPLGTWSHTVPGTPGGNRYGWFPFNQFAALQVRNSKRTPA